MTYTVSSGTLNPTQLNSLCVARCCLLVVQQLLKAKKISRFLKCKTRKTISVDKAATVVNSCCRKVGLCPCIPRVDANILFKYEPNFVLQCNSCHPHGRTTGGRRSRVCGLVSAECEPITGVWCAPNSPPKVPFPVDRLPNPNTCLIPGPVRPMVPNGCRMRSAIFPQCTIALDRQTDRQTVHGKVC